MASTHTPNAAYPWQTDWNLYSEMAQALFQHLKCRARLPQRLVSFVGCDAVSYLEQGACETRREGLKFGQCLVEDGIISHVGRTRSFEDSPRWYRFNVPTADEIAYRIGLTRFPVVREEDWDELRGDSGSLLAFSEASCEMMDQDLLRDERGGVMEPEALRQIPVGGAIGDRGRCDREYKSWNDGLSDRGTEVEGDFEEPKVAYRVLNYTCFDGDGECGRGKGGSGGGMTAVFSNVPALREKLSNALMDRSFVEERGRGMGKEGKGEAASDGGRRWGRGMWGRSWRRREKGQGFGGRLG
eukprot:GFKZ01002092.1.p2 GENE.GFKZ01002092.1~~GFKZ01002092.1.p2  ORF type:complete len:299 (+),score=43.64 GFKZ01002092.1:167-1063(+)